ncbi:MAG: molybdopterin molybdotransferase MoeA [Candidatus Riflebacteria bacterium]|nr:molybdopterin molybdotransferase MoeA [Candidatus Riflebacteria bacterium]
MLYPISKSMEFSEAQKEIRNFFHSLPVEHSPLLLALSRSLAQDIFSPFSIPPIDNSAMDGYALSGDGNDPDGYLLLPSSTFPDSIPSGAKCAFRVLTGRIVPSWAQCVAAQEHCNVRNGRVFPGTTYPIGHNIRRVGEDVLKDSILMKAGRHIDATALTRLASAGLTEIPVISQPRVLILTGGDEIVRAPALPDRQLPRYECDSALLAGLLTEIGAIPCILPHQPDEPSAIQKTLENAPTWDLLLTCGGAADSELDFIRPVLREMGAKFRFERVAVKPGRPTAFGTLAGKPFFCLPGNPVAVFTSFLAFVDPAISLMIGHTYPAAPHRRIPLRDTYPGDEKRHRIVRAVMDWSGATPKAVPYPDSGSGLIRSLTDCDVLLSLPPGGELPAGSPVDILWMRA